MFSWQLDLDKNLSCLCFDWMLQSSSGWQSKRRQDKFLSRSSCIPREHLSSFHVCRSNWETRISRTLCLPRITICMLVFHIRAREEKYFKKFIVCKFSLTDQDWFDCGDDHYDTVDGKSIRRKIRSSEDRKFQGLTFQQKLSVHS